MLTAVSKMLEESKEPKVQCAKTIVDEIIKNQEQAQQSLNIIYPKDVDSTLDTEANEARKELS